MEALPITEEVLSSVRLSVKNQMGEFRFQHTAGVEKAAATLGEALLKDKIPELRLAALLHDVAKELPHDTEEACLQKYGLPQDTAKPVRHSFIGAFYAKELFPAYVTEEISHAIYLHTTGGAAMSLFEKILFLADFIEENRKIPFCLAVRERLMPVLNGTLSSDEKLLLLDETLLWSLSKTVKNLVTRQMPIAKETLIAYNYYVSMLSSL